ncbi:hypothetical protein ACTL6P_04650 [Endozoicomonas acroporae]|uniref:hypothetical protein n=1 Tax=Endozoicomonas acroporae TaxID=1701104 RepID=UPI0015E0C874|nr:hypothetical protein [Endozoicomonas acroporae]
MDVDLEVAVEVTVNPVKLHQAAKNVRPHFHTLNDAEKKHLLRMLSLEFDSQDEKT